MEIQSKKKNTWTIQKKNSLETVCEESQTLDLVNEDVKIAI